MTKESFKRQMRLLHLEDNENDHILVREMLRADGLPCELVSVKCRTDFETALRQNGYDLIISDFSLPSYDGLRALSIARELHPETPFIFFSGTIGEEVAVESLKNGATDYILKQRPHRLVAAVRNALRSVEERGRRQHAETELQKIEERFRIVSRATNDVVWEWDIKTNKIWFSENFRAVFGHAPEEIGATLENWLNLFHPDDKARIVSGVTSLLASGGRIWWSEHRLRRANGSYAHILDRASVVYDKENKPLRMVGVTIDLTERKHAEDKIREQAALLDKAQDAIIVCSYEREIVFWNQGAERLYGWRTGEVIGKNVRELLFKDTCPAQLQDAIKSLDERGEWSGELSEFTKAGRTVIVQARGTLIRDERGQPQSLLIINTDITERRQLEEQFLRAQRLESLGVLVSGIAHDLNNALVPIMVGVDILRTQSLSPDAMSMLRTMETSARRSADMVKQMLTFARGGEASKAIVRPGQLLKEMGKIITDTFPKSIQCRVDVEKKSWSVSGWPTQLHQVLLNLCVNARDAMPDGGRITLATENVELTTAELAAHPDTKPGKYLCLTVADSGVGIPAEALGKIFQPFFTTKAIGKGTGLGLSTSLGIIKSHGGFITVESQPGHGTEFKVYLPAASGDLGEPVHEKISLHTGNGECVLIVDDEEGILAIIRAALENYGYKVLVAASGPDAITRFAENPAAIDLVITDLDMPFMNGHQVIAGLRKISPQLKIIIASGSEKEVEESKRRDSSDAFIEKPFSTETLLETVYKVLALKK